MYDNTIDIVYNTVTKTLKRVTDGNYSSEYYLDDGTLRFYLKFNHDAPTQGKPGERHMCRLDVEHFDADGLITQVVSQWMALRTDIGKQDATNSLHAANALADFLDPTNLARIIARES